MIQKQQFIKFRYVPSQFLNMLVCVHFQKLYKLILVINPLMSSYSKNKPPRQPFFPAFQTSSSAQSCSMCVEYEQDIAILQQKLMNTHNKLIQQLDICREQQLQIIRYKQELETGSSNNTQQNSQSRSLNKSPGKISSIKISDEYQHSLEPLLQNKNQLLKNDLQAMRNKVLSQIKKTNIVKQKIRQKQVTHEKQIEEYRVKIKQLQYEISSLNDENERLVQQCQFLQRGLEDNMHKKCQCGFEQKYYELDQAFMNQRNLTTQLIQQNNTLQTQLYQQKIKIAQKQNKREPLKPCQANKSNSKVRSKQKKKTDFAETRNLIQKLQQAERQIRLKR